MVIFVQGKPQPKGSMKPIPNKRTGKTMLIDQNKHLKKWQKKIADEARMWMFSNKRAPTSDAVILRILFKMPRPKSVSSTKRPYVTVKPDLDKMCRAVLDALTEVVYHDDCQVIEISARKEYALKEADVGVHISAGVETALKAPLLEE